MKQLLFDIFIYIFEFVIAYVFISYNYKKTKKTWFITFTGVVLFSVGALLLKYINNDVLNLVSCFLINALFFILCFDVKIKEAVIFSIMLDVIMLCSEMITIYLASFVSKIPTDSYRNNMVVFMILTIISKLIYFGLSQVLGYLINALMFKSNKSSKFMPLFIFPVLSIAISLLFLRMSFINKYDNTYNIVFVVISILMIIANVYIFVYYQTLAKNESYLNEMQIENRMHETNESYFEILQHQNNDMRMFFHDTKNHFITIANMDSAEEISGYVSNVIGDMQKYDIIQLTNNKILDVLLSKYSALCLANNIKLNIEAKTADLSYVSDSDLSIIVNNLMDNAVEAAKNSVDKYIDFSLRCVNDFDILTVANSCDSEPLHSGQKLITTKGEKAYHGYGTAIIKKYTSKYNAKYEWFYEKEKRRFNSTIIIHHK